MLSTQLSKNGILIVAKRQEIGPWKPG